MVTKEAKERLQKLQADLSKSKDSIAQETDEMHEIITEIDKIEKEQNLS